MPLSDTTVRMVKPRLKTFKLSDGHGLYLEVAPSGSRYWRFKYRFGGKEKRLALGVYPVVTLARARADTLEARRLLHDRIDPAMRKKERSVKRSSPPPIRSNRSPETGTASCGRSGRNTMLAT